MKKVFSFTLVMLLSSFILTVPAFAENIETTATLGTKIWAWKVGNTGNLDEVFNPTVPFQIPRQNELNNSVLDFDLVGDYYRRIDCGINQISIPAPTSDGFYGDVEVSFNCYVVLDNPDGAVPSGTWSNSLNTFNVRVSTSNGEVIQDVTPTLHFYDVNQSLRPSSDVSKGFHVTFNIHISETTPVLNISLGNSGWAPVRWVSDDVYVGFNKTVEYYVPSCVLIADRTSAELEEIREITNIIIEQNQLTNEFYGDIISKVDDLYTEVGNLADLQQEAIDQFDNWNIVSSVPGSVIDKIDQAEDVLDELHQLEKPEPDQIVPELDTDTTEIAQILEPYFQNTLILQILMMTLGFGFVSYVLFGKKG